MTDRREVDALLGAFDTGDEYDDAVATVERVLDLRDTLPQDHPVRAAADALADQAQAALRRAGAAYFSAFAAISESDPPHVTEGCDR